MAMPGARPVHRAATRLSMHATPQFLDAYTRLFLPQERNLIDDRIRSFAAAIEDPRADQEMYARRVLGVTEPLYELRITRSDAVFLRWEGLDITLVHISRPGDRHAIEHVLEPLADGPVVLEQSPTTPAPRWFYPGARNPLVPRTEVRIDSAAGQGPWLRFLDDQQVAIRQTIIESMVAGRVKKPIFVTGGAGTGKTATLLSLLEWLPIYGVTAVWCRELGGRDTLAAAGVNSVGGSVMLVDGPSRLGEVSRRWDEAVEIGARGMVVGVNLDQYPAYLVDRLVDATGPVRYGLTRPYRRQDAPIPAGLIR